MLLASGLEIDDEDVATFCLDNGIKRLALFGSALRGELRPDSDIDLLVEFKPGHTPGMLGMARMQRALEDLLGGHHGVDLRTYGDLSKYFRDDVRATARPVFDAAA